MTNADLALAAAGPGRAAPPARAVPPRPPPARSGQARADGQRARQRSGRSGRAPGRVVAAAPARRRTPAERSPLVPPASPGPVVALGLVWALALVGAAALGSAALFVLLVPVATVAAASGLRAARSGAAPVRAAAAVCAPLVAALGLVVASRQDSGVAAILVLAVCLFDAANFVVGTGAVGGVVGSLAGAVTVALLMVVLAAVVPAPLAGHPIDAFAVVAVVLCPAGVHLGRRLTGPARLPAFRRLDSLILAGPAWVVLTVVLLHR